MSNNFNLSQAVNTPFSFRNKIINGDFRVWQRGLTIGPYSDGVARYLADRWRTSSASVVHSASRGNLAPDELDPIYHELVVATTAGTAGYCIATQPIESVRQLAGKTVTVSFYAKADAAKPMSVEVHQYFGGGGSPSAGVICGVQKVNLITSWQKFEVVISVPSISGKTLGTDGKDALQINFWFAAGSSFDTRTDTLGHQAGTFDIAQVQVEEGSVATPFEQRPIGLERSLCERYYQTGSYGGTTVCYATGTWIFKLELQTSLRASPNSYSFTASNGSHSDLSSGWAANSAYINGLRFLKTGGVSAPPNVGYVDGTYVVEAEL